MHTYLNIHLSSGLKERPMLSALLYCRDNKALHYTVGKGRRNVSIGINSEDEPRAQSTGKSVLSTSTSHKTRLAPPSLHFEGASGTLKCRNKTTTSKWKAEFIRNSLPVPVMEKGTAEQSHTHPSHPCSDASSSHTGNGTETPQSWAWTHQRQLGHSCPALPITALSP